MHLRGTCRGSFELLRELGLLFPPASSVYAKLSLAQHTLTPALHLKQGRLMS